ncbi:MAG: VOC family protein [Patescibacteria group bacterium]|nr:VOC family protein [Patescibacteria group bacterium]
MIASTLSPCIVTDKVDASRAFYVKHFGAKVTFDCGWYVNLQIGSAAAALQFMAPRESGPPACNPAGLMYNLCVADVDAEYQRLTSEGLTPVMPLADHPWGDRGFAMVDPSGITLYIYSDREPAEEFRPFFQA